MRIACPSCNAAYQVPDEQLRGGRVVRCVRCGTDWAPIVAVPEAEPDSEPGPEPAAPRNADPVDFTTEPGPEPVATRRMALDEADFAPSSTAPAAAPAARKPLPAKRRFPALAVAWVVSLAVVIGAVAYLAVGRAQIMYGWPPSIRLYAAIGLAPHP